VENGQVKFTPPTTAEAIEDNGFPSMFWLVHDNVYNKAREELTPDGREMMKTMDTVIAKEGLGSVRFLPTLQSFSKFPDVALQADDVGPKLIIDHLVKMIYGKEPISDWPKVIEE
jgi:putative aldouronate transport system substrate-binding protein